MGNFFFKHINAFRLCALSVKLGRINRAFGAPIRSSAKNACLSVFLFVCLYTFFSAISKPIVLLFGPNLIFALGKVLRQNYFDRRL